MHMYNVLYLKVKNDGPQKGKTFFSVTVSDTLSCNTRWKAHISLQLRQSNLDIVKFLSADKHSKSIGIEVNVHVCIYTDAEHFYISGQGYN